MAKAAKSVVPFRGDVLGHIYKHGHAADVIAACKITRQALEQWQTIPVRRVLTVEKITGIPRHLIRGDIYPAP